MLAMSKVSAKVQRAAWTSPRRCHHDMDTQSNREGEGKHLLQSPPWQQSSA